MPSSRWRRIQGRDVHTRRLRCSERCLAVQLAEWSCRWAVTGGCAMAAQFWALNAVASRRNPATYSSARWRAVEHLAADGYGESAGSRQLPGPGSLRRDGRPRSRPDAQHLPGKHHTTGLLADHLHSVGTALAIGGDLVHMNEVDIRTARSTPGAGSRPA